MNVKMNMIDLFAGTGAFSYVFQSKFNIIYANDFDVNSKKIYDLNFDFKLDTTDINNIDKYPEHYLLTAGFPCQPFSIAGKQKGFDDKRSNVFFKLIDIIKKKNPEIVLLENVKNLKTHNKGKTFKIICEELTKLNYFIKYKVLNTCKVTNIPQNRERIYIICFKNKIKYDNFTFDFIEVENKKIIDFLEKDINEKYYYKEKIKIYEKLKTGITKHINTNTIYQYRRYYVRENKNNVCPTLTANMGTGGHNVPIILDDKGIRKLTPRECFNLQGFPKTYKLPKISDCEIYKLAGNAVSYPIIKNIASVIVNILRKINI